MNIIICGAGTVGYSIAKQLSAQGHSITVIDQESKDIKKINDNCCPTERVCHMGIRFFQIQDWAHKDIIMKHIPGAINPPNDATKPLGAVSSL